MNDAPAARQGRASAIAAGGRTRSSTTSGISRWISTSSDDASGELVRSCGATGAGRCPSTTRDYLPTPASDLARRCSREHLAATGIDPRGRRITLVTNPRVLGLPVQPGELLPVPERVTAILGCVVVEVHNTYGERHLYTLRPGRRARPARVFSAQMDKRFYVSPFIDNDGDVPRHRPRHAAIDSRSASTSARAASRCSRRA